MSLEDELREEMEMPGPRYPPDPPRPPIDDFYRNEIHRAWASTVKHLVWVLGIAAVVYMICRWGN